DKFYDHHLRSTNPLVVLAVFIALVLNVFGHLTRPWCNVTLRLLQMMLKTAFTSGKEPSQTEKLVLTNFPRDIRTVRKIFDLEAKTVVYAACPRCSCTYKPTTQDNILIYP
ncbi:hypothetical protein BJ138DRAFT_973152, partial [Hygrophoropsis aurantiaca]